VLLDLEVRLLLGCDLDCDLTWLLLTMAACLRGRLVAIEGFSEVIDCVIEARRRLESRIGMLESEEFAVSMVGL